MSVQSGAGPRAARPLLFPAMILHAIPVEAVPESKALLEVFPDVRAELGSRGVGVERAEGETAAQHHDRLATALMALFRDTRGERAYETLYRHSRASVLQWVERRIQESHRALDPSELVQDTYVNVYRYSSRFRSDHPASFRVWVRTISANAVRRALTRRADCSLQALPEGLQEPADPGETPQHAAMATEQRGELRRAFLLVLLHYARAWQELAPRDRRALQLVEVQGLSYAETGRRLEVGPSNMKMIMFRARRRIHARIRCALQGAAEEREGREARVA